MEVIAGELRSFLFSSHQVIKVNIWCNKENLDDIHLIFLTNIFHNVFVLLVGKLGFFFRVFTRVKFPENSRWFFFIFPGVSRYDFYYYFSKYRKLKQQQKFCNLIWVLNLQNFISFQLITLGRFPEWTQYWLRIPGEKNIPWDFQDFEVFQGGRHPGFFFVFPAMNYNYEGNGAMEFGNLLNCQETKEKFEVQMVSWE